MNQKYSISCAVLLICLPILAACGSPSPTATPTPLPTSSPTIPPPTPTLSPTATTVPEQILDDFESPQTAWQPATVQIYTDSSATSVKLTKEHVTQGAQALELSFDKTDLPKAIFFILEPMDLSQVHILRFDIYNPDTASGVAIAFNTGPDRIWHESDTYVLSSGQQTVEFDLTQSIYKTAATNWEFYASIANLDSTQQFSIVLFPAQAGVVIVDNIRLIPVRP